MLNINSTVIYGGNGACRVCDIRKEKFGKETREFYILKPVNDEKSTIYLPVDNEVLLSKIRKVMSKDEIDALIDSISDRSIGWIEDNRERSENFNKILDTGDRSDIMTLIKTLYLQKQQRANDGKKLRSSDEAVMTRAEKLLYEEFALVLDIKKDEVVSYIAARLEK